ncbi:hemopexin repeat-containing protein [Streptomyces sp. NPDC005648]|uniref:hemopexin repeat-containing protein n=1 Tax=Streptomyces sp. NPDC005648 TaxID=3157044 RepID=UPI0033A990EE
MAQARTVFFFRGGKYVRYEIDPATGAESVNHDIYPRDVSEAWTAMPASFTHGFDAALTWPDGYVYFFKGPQYVRWDATDDTVDASFYPHATADQWPALPASFAAGIDAAINWGDGRAFFFKGSQYVRYDIKDNFVDHNIYPRDISDGWPDFPAAFKNGIDAAVNWGNGTAYFFKGGSYLNYDIQNSKVRPGYPLPITEPGKWPELVQAGFTGPLDDVIEWPQADVASVKIPDRLLSCSKSSLPRVRCGGEFDMHAVFTEANPSIPACGEYRQYVRGVLEVNGQPVRFVLRENGVPAPRLMRPRPGPGSTDDNFQEDGQAASNPDNPFHVDLDYGHRNASVGNGNRNDMYLLDRRSGAEYVGRDTPGGNGPAGIFFKIDVDFRGQLIDVCNGGTVLFTREWTVNCSVP